MGVSSGPVVDTARDVPRPLHLRWRNIGLVFLGGTLGTAARYLLSTVIPAWQGIPIGTFVINVVGAFVLGVLLEALTRRGPDDGMRRDLRLLVGTGVLGGFTTYSSFAVDADGLLTSHLLWGSLLYSAATLLIGAAASVAGITIATTVHRKRAMQ